ncbi:hypothetical protein [Candidatus Viadribacter manganicus]|uniref:Uncharacterized protein n=1 Tax=Candidatus Viadribacter manganicus TaxID=1759059 RepID=A0A1B1AFH3_9PROT|nr:hypothetical protein [Candidatus Viadribacter manganicus]ANP45281.1 hypothetical protein ATE48_04820 [Candidatus Viadribacter manganicus]
MIFVLTLCLEIANITSLIESESESWDSLMRYLALNTVALAMIAIALLAKHPRIVRVARLG